MRSRTKEREIKSAFSWLLDVSAHFHFRYGATSCNIEPSIIINWQGKNIIIAKWQHGNVIIGVYNQAPNFITATTKFLLSVPCLLHQVCHRAWNNMFLINVLSLSLTVCAILPWSNKNRHIAKSDNLVSGVCLA